ncbi:hypothetical protein ACTQ1N_11490 [Porcincola sp. LCP21S3_C12]
MDTRTPKERRKLMNRLMAYRKEYFVLSMLRLLWDDYGWEEV